MPSFEFQGFVSTVYPYGRDANGRPLGTVDPGDIRFFDEEPDWPWVPVIPPGTNEPPSSSDGEDEQRGGIETGPGPADVPAPLADAAPEPAAGPVPAPPAVVPPAGPAFAVTTDQGA